MYYYLPHEANIPLAIEPFPKTALSRFLPRGG